MSSQLTDILLCASFLLVFCLVRLMPLNTRCACVVEQGVLLLKGGDWDVF